MEALSANPERHSWLTSELLETILKSSENLENVKVINFVLHDAVGKGENMTSYLMRVTVNYAVDGAMKTIKQKTFVIKTTLANEEMREKIQNIGLFDKEIAFYRDISPKFKKYAKMIDKDFKCAPRIFAISDNPAYIIFEDLRADNFRNMDRRIGIDFNTAAMTLHKLAKMHAITAMIYEDDAELFEHHKKRVISKENYEFLGAFTCGIRDCQQVCLKWPGYEHFYDKLQNWIDNTVEISETTYSKDDTTFNTLTHGDLWVNNIMFKFDAENNPIDVLMVDYQIGYYGPPALDLTYLFYSSTTNELREQDWDRLLQIYHVELVKSLHLVEYPKRIPSLTELQIHMLKKSLCSAIIAFTLIPPRHMDTDIEAMMSNAEDILKSRYTVYDKPVVSERLKYLLDYFDRKGLFEASS